MGKYSTPRVPIQTPMFDEHGMVTRPWIIFWERLKYAEAGEEGPPGPAAGLIFQRTLLLKDLTPGNDIADHVTVYADGTATRLVSVLRKEITDDLVVRVNKNGDPLVTLTIPYTTAVDTPVETTTFTGSTTMTDGDVLSWDILDSDDTKDREGIASFTLEWSSGTV